MVVWAEVLVVVGQSGELDGGARVFRRDLLRLSREKERGERKKERGREREREGEGNRRPGFRVVHAYPHPVHKG